MENASKALIIAGAILISILIISFGVIILGQGGDVIQNANMNETEMASFNGKFTAYEGSAVKGSNVRQLIRTVTQSNANNPDNQVTIGSTDTVTDDTYKDSASSFTPSATYSVKCVFEKGLVKHITITTPSGS